MARLTKSSDDGEISAEEFEAANRAGAARRSRGVVTSARYFTTGRRLSLRLSTGVLLVVPVDKIEGLADAPNEALRDVLIGPGGLSVHFPQLDADVSAVGLLDGIFGSPSWMADEFEAGEPFGDVHQQVLSALAGEIEARTNPSRRLDDETYVVPRDLRFAGEGNPFAGQSGHVPDAVTQEFIRSLRTIVHETVDEMGRDTKPAPIAAARSRPQKRAPQSKAKP